MMSEWISVKERLPDGPQEVFVYPSFFGRPSAARYYEFSRSWQQAGVNGDIGGYVTHWMPLPEPPKGQA